MKIIGTVRKIKDNWISVKTDFDKWKIGDKVVIKRGSTRSLAQNRTYWKYLNWVIDRGNLRDQGHFSAMGLHENLKDYFLSEKKFSRGDLKKMEEGTTTTLNKLEFNEYWKCVDEFIKEFFSIDTNPFWEDLEKYQRENGLGIYA